uniref:Uncharacterized protein n=1 Tax=Heterorhabditis bacteriophora TaxID=37862 RepID=A0A1I7WWU3_HETBA
MGTAQMEHISSCAHIYIYIYIYLFIAK